MGLSLVTPHEHAQWLVNGTAGVEFGPSAAMDAARAYLARPSLHWIMVLASRERGSGKSLTCEWLRVRLEELGAGYYGGRDATAHEAAAMAAKRRASSRVSLWCDCAALEGLGELKPWERAAVVERLRSSWLVVFDDLGTEPASVDLRGVLQTRHGRGLLTLVTTNLVSNGKDPEGPPLGRASKEWNARYDGRIASRLRAMGDADAGRVTAWVHCPDRDHRGRVEPKLLPVAPEQPVVVDFDALTAPLLAAFARRRRVEQAAASEREARAKADADAFNARLEALTVLDYVAGELGKGEGFVLRAIGRDKRSLSIEDKPRMLALLTEAARAAGGGT